MSRPKNKPVKVVHRRLGREVAWGQAWTDKNLIEIDPRLGAKRALETLAHEICHLALPELTDHPVKSAAYRKGEAKVDRMGKMISKVLWAQNYRRVLMDKNAKPPRIT
jgi:predicted SprT family Zn-dependent metalloprotease